MLTAHQLYIVRRLTGQGKSFEEARKAALAEPEPTFKSCHAMPVSKSKSESESESKSESEPVGHLTSKGETMPINNRKPIAFTVVSAESTTSQKGESMHDDIPLDQAITNALKDAAKVSRRQQRKSAASKPYTQKVGDIMKAKQSLKSKAAHAEVVARGNFVAEFGSTAGWQSETYVQPKNGEAWAYKAYNYDAGNPLVAEIDTAHWIAAYQSQKKARGNRRPDRTELNKVGVVNYNQGSKVYSVRIDEHHRVNFVRDARKS